MADISKVRLPDNSEYGIKDTVARAKGSIYYGTCTTAAGTKDKVATVSSDQNFVLQKGTMIAIKFSNSNSYSATSDSKVTLNVNNTGALNIWYYNTNNNTGTNTAAYGVANVYNYYMYDGTYWVFAGRSADFNDGNYNLRFNAAIKSGTDDIVAGNLICANNSNLYYHLKKGTAFDIRWPIMYANSNITANNTGTNNYMFINFNVNTTQSMTLTAYKPVYIKGILSGTIFTPVSTTPLTQTAPSSADNYHYLYLGVAASATHLYLFDYHPIYKYGANGFAIYEQTLAVNNILANTNLDTVKTVGFYYAGGNNNCTNMPSDYTGANNFGLEVIKRAIGDYYAQIYYPHNSTTTWVRICQSGTWGDWTDYTGRVYQSGTTTPNWRKVVLGGQSDSDPGVDSVATRSSVYVTPTIEVQSSTGTLRASNLLTTNLNGENVDDLIEKVSDDLLIAEGNPSTFETQSSQMAKETEVYMEPVQSLNGYDKPWLGGAGKNKWSLGDITTQQSGIAFSLPAGTYTCSCTPNGNQVVAIRFVYSDDSSDVVRMDTSNNYTATVTLTSVVVKVNTGLGTNTTATNVQVESGFTKTDYEPYENICPISGRTQAEIWGSGKNLLPTNLTEIKSINTTGTWSGDAYTINDVTFTVQTDGDKVVGINANGTASADATLFVYGGTVSSSKDILFPGDIKISIGTANNGSTTTFLGVVWSTIQNKFVYGTEAVSGGYNMTGFGVRIKSSYNAQNVLFKPMIRLSDEDATFVPYVQGDSVTIPLGSTVYGGTLNVETGVLTIDTYFKEFDGTENITAIGSGANRFYRFIPDVQFPGASTQKYGCSHFENAEIISTTTVFGCYCYYSSANVASYVQFRPNIASITDADTFKAWLTAQYNNGTPVQVWSKLRTPVTITLTPAQIHLLKGLNNVFTDADSINLTYREGEFATLGDLSDVSKVKFDGVIKVGSYGITQGTLIVADENGYYNTIGLDTTAEFSVDYPILYSDTAYAANSFASSGIYSIINFNITTMQNITLTPGKEVFIECERYSNAGAFNQSSYILKLNTLNFFTQEQFTTDYYYYSIGIASSNSNVVLNNNFMVYKCISGMFSFLIQISQHSLSAHSCKVSEVAGGSSYCESYMDSNNLNEIFLSPQDYSLDPIFKKLEKTIYWIEEDSFASDYTNRPYNNKDVAFTLTVHKLRDEDDNYYVQEFEDRDFSKYRRYYVSDAWTPWHLVEQKDKKIAPIYIGTCASAAATSTKEVVVSADQDFILQVGAIIAIKFTYSNTASNVTFNVNGTGDKQIYYADAVYTSTATQQTGLANRYIYYMYDGTYWVWINSDYESNTYDRVRMQMNIKAGSSAITAGNIIVAGEDGLYKHLKTGGAFDITQPILYAGSNISANATNNNTYVIMPLTVTTTQSLTLTANKTVYIKGTLNGATFTPISTTPLTQTRPTSADGYQYMVLGKAVSTTQLYLTQDHRIFEYTNGLFRLIG